MSPGGVELVGLGAAVLLGASTQRITGLGFALVASPFIVLVLGGFTGVLVVNVLGSLTSALVLVRVRREVDVRRALSLAGPAVAAVVPGAWVARHSSPALLQSLVGLCVVCALVVVLAVGRRAEGASGAPGRSGRAPWAGVVAAGLTSGFMNATAGVGGPAVTVYAVATRWQQRPFAASAQLYFAIVGTASLAVKGLPSMSLQAWAMAASALVVGLVVGDRLQARVPAPMARHAAVALALVGGSLTLGKGLAGLLG